MIPLLTRRALSPVEIPAPRRQMSRFITATVGFASIAATVWLAPMAHAAGQYVRTQSGLVPCLVTATDQSRGEEYPPSPVTTPAAFEKAPVSRDDNKHRLQIAVIDAYQQILLGQRRYRRHSSRTMCSWSRVRRCTSRGGPSPGQRRHPVHQRRQRPRLVRPRRRCVTVLSRIAAIKRRRANNVAL